MAENYLATSFEVGVVRGEEQDWLTNSMDAASDFVCDGEMPSDLSEDVAHMLRFQESWGWEYSKYEDRVVIYCEECGNLEALVTLLQEFLARFFPDRAIVFSWAEWCSKPRPGQFGGGAVIVRPTPDDTTWILTEDVGVDHDRLL